MDHAVAAQDLAAVIAPRAVGGRRRVGVHHLRIHRNAVVPHHGEVLRQPVEHAPGRRRDEAAGVAIEAGDLLPLDQGDRMVVGGDRRAADLRRPLPPELGHHLAILVPDLAPQIAGIAGAGAVPGGLGIEHHHAPPPAHQRKRGGKPHIAGAHDHHLGLRRGPLVGHIGARRQVPPVGGGFENPPSAHHRPSPSSAARHGTDPKRKCIANPRYARRYLSAIRFLGRLGWVRCRLLMHLHALSGRRLASSVQLYQLATEGVWIGYSPTITCRRLSLSNTPLLYLDTIDDLLFPSPTDSLANISSAFLLLSEGSTPNVTISVLMIWPRGTDWPITLTSRSPSFRY